MFVVVCKRIKHYFYYICKTLYQFQEFVKYSRVQMNKMQKSLTTERLVLRNIEVDEYENLFDIRFHPEVIKHIKRDIIDDKIELKAFILNRIQDVENGKTCFWGISELGYSKLIGTICLWNFNDEKTIAEIGYELHPDYHKKGFMSESINAVLNFGFDNLQLKTIEAFTSKYNNSSKTLLKKFDFSLDINRKDKGFPDNIIYIKHYA